MSKYFNLATLLTLHHDSIIRWYGDGLKLNNEYPKIYQLAEENHAFNYQLWLAEDRARRDDMGPEFVYQAKREIDKCNQERNNRMEAMDEWFFHHFNPSSSASCPVNSESPGMMTDRLSILALKSYHMGIQTHRLDVSSEHIARCQQKLQVINQQLQQLGECLASFLLEMESGKRTFKVYHQFKMYNDPNLNPELYNSHQPDLN